MGCTKRARIFPALRHWPVVSRGLAEHLKNVNPSVANSAREGGKWQKRRSPLVHAGLSTGAAPRVFWRCDMWLNECNQHGSQLFDAHQEWNTTVSDEATDRAPANGAAAANDGRNQQQYADAQGHR